MRHLIKYSFLQSFRRKELVFWGILFPILLGTMFRFSFGTGKSEMSISLIPVGVAIEKSEENNPFDSFLKELDQDMIDVSYMTEEEGKEALQKGEVKGVYVAGTDRVLYVAASGLEESILQTFLKSYNENEIMIQEILKDHPENLELVLDTMGDYQELTKEVSIGGSNVDNDIQYYFALIAMACLYGGFLGLKKAEDLMANVSKLGARRSVAPTHKLKIVLVDMMSVFALHFFNIMVLLLYLNFVLQIPFGGNWGGIALVSLFGTFIGVSIGLLLGSISKFSEGMKIALLITFSMVCSFMSGLMINNIKDIIEKNIPLLNRINPAALITDALYCLVVYDDPGRYNRNLLILGGMAVGMILISYALIRRERYDSI